LGFLAERFFAEDPKAFLIKTRQFAEILLKEIAARTDTYRLELREKFIAMLQRLQSERDNPREAIDGFHVIRKRGNVAAHDLSRHCIACLRCR
jgi:type I restriction enzyme R subunit